MFLFTLATDQSKSATEASRTINTKNGKDSKRDKASSRQYENITSFEEAREAYCQKPVFLVFPIKSKNAQQESRNEKSAPQE